MITIVLALICGLGYRLRGSSGEGGWVEKIFKFTPGTVMGRLLFWCLPITVLLCGWQMLYMFIPLMAASYVGVMFGYWGKFDLENPSNRNWWNYFKLTVKGASIAMPIFFTLWICQMLGIYHGSLGLWAIVAGALFVPYYLAGITISGFIKLPMLQSASEWGEFLLGTTIAYGLLQNLY